MAKQLLYLIILTVGVSCKLDAQGSKKTIAHIPKKTDLIKEIKGIHFDFKATRINSFKKTIIEINATLYNDNIDTIYFLTTTCDGEQYSLRYDTVKFELAPFMSCNASFPKIEKIAPKAQYDFQAHFSCNNNETKIELGFDFYSVDKSFNLTHKTLGSINIFNRSLKEQTIIWAREKTIK